VKKSCGTPVLYFTYLGSNRLFAIKAENLRQGLSQGSVVDVGPKQQKIVLLGNDNGCALFFRYKGKRNVLRFSPMCIDLHTISEILLFVKPQIKKIIKKLIGLSLSLSK